jgi:hypothetical protein
MQRRISSKGFNVPAHQHTDVERMKHETVFIPSNTIPAWGSYFTVDIKEKNVLIHGLTLRLNASAITGLTSGTARYTPAWFWFSRIELTINNVVIDTVYGNQQYLLNQMFNEDLKRQYINIGTGNYASVSQRQTLASTANDYYIPLWAFFRQTHMPYIFPKDDVQLRIYMDTASNNMVSTTGAVGTMASTLNSCQLLVSLSRLGSTSVANIRKELTKSAHDYQFTELRIGTYTVASGSTNTSIILSSLVGPVSFLYFVVRPTNATGDNYFTYTAIKDFAILDSGSTNIVGGQAIPSSLALTVYNRDWFRSSFTAESPNNNVYVYSFGASPSETMWSGKIYNHHNFIGSEQLQINFTSALGSAVQVDIYAQVNAYIKSSANDVKKISINQL